MPRDEKIERFAIKITNFINPHLFQFKLENIVGQFDIDVEQKLRQNAEKCAAAGYHPEQGAIVAAYILPWGKWVRAEVDLILEENHTLQYVVWCLDHGVPMKLASQHLRPIPKDIQDLPPNAYTGGLAKCVPIEKRLNYASLQNETYGVDDFPEYLVVNAKQVIDEAAEIYFTPRQTIGQQIFGDIYIIKYCGTKVDFLHELAKTDSVRIGDRVIANGIEEMRTIKKQRYENHLGHLNIRNVVKPDIISSNMSGISVCTKDMEDDDKMILDWSRQNNKLAKEMEHELKDRFEKVLRTLDVYEVPRAYLYRSESTINSSSSLHFSHMDSMSTLKSTSTTDVCAARSDPLEIVDTTINPHLSALNRQFKAASINSASINKPKSKKESKKAIYIPSGFESDLVNFQKYNQFY
ncbi:uncharacterized protein LOC129576961 [Sitodiplosis mosellana]|uniref:uncharacterized protein LOC129576961 n=1 Tax=Sitodiplosis mosellana TaxID=263140 RepID=UPI0024444F4C|nr:uncharacterized protein LOC129576961 [Sitodiplosis mosellana]